MKLLIPIFNNLPIEGGFAVGNIAKVKGLKTQFQLQCQLWKDFTLLEEVKVPFGDLAFQTKFLSEIFSSEALSKAGVAVVEFAPAPPQPIPFEVSMILRAKNREQAPWSGILYDLIVDKKPGHKYSPILHCAHTASVSSDFDTWVVMTNFRPSYLPAQSSSQSMQMETKNPQGDLLNVEMLQIPFNATTEISFNQSFQKYSGFKAGGQLNFKGGESQFAIFTVFWNEKSGSIGIEHSLPPFYYSSAVMNPQLRGTFYQHAFGSKQ